MIDQQISDRTVPAHFEASADALIEVFEQIQAEHRALDVRIQEMCAALHLSPEEETEVHRLKKVKLHKKEQLVRLSDRLSYVAAS